MLMTEHNAFAHTQTLSAPVLALFGPPGSGKGTQASLLAEKLGYVHIATGNLLRDAVAAGTPLGQQVKAIMAAGSLVSDDLVLQLLVDALQKAGSRPVVVDGFPRTQPQIAMLDEALATVNRNIATVLFLQVPDAFIEERLVGRVSCGQCGASYHLTAHPPKQAGVCDKCSATQFVQRDDDTLAVVQQRLKVYYQQTHPVLQVYRERGLVREIDGQGDVSTIFTRIEAHLPAGVAHA